MHYLSHRLEQEKHGVFWVQQLHGSSIWKISKKLFVINIEYRCGLDIESESSDDDVPESHKNKQEGRPVIIYWSRTHSQLKQVMSEIGKLKHRLQVALIASKTQYWTNSEIKEYVEETQANLNDICK